jgi:signal transduction histidine kinase
VRLAFRPLQIFAYDATFRPHVPFAPEFPQTLRETLAGGERVATARRQMELPDRNLEIFSVGLATGWSPGPCAFLLAQRTGPATAVVSWSQAVDSLPLLAGLIAAMWVASGPIVRRVRGLTDAVKRSAASRYAAVVPETGSDEITALARAFNEAGREVREQITQLEARDRTLREFLANTTHDVMIPLTVLQGHLAHLQQTDTSDPARVSVLVRALQEAHYMASLLHNLGAAAKLEAPDQLVQWHPIDLNALIERVVERHRPVAGPAGIAIDFAIPEARIVLEGDVTLLEQAVSNVVHNALRYNRRGGHVAVVLDQIARRDTAFSLRVIDDGPGVPEEQLARLTERRYRDEAARQRDPNGLGLGLAIAREVAEQHGLRLNIRRAEAGGLEVEFRKEPA